MVLQDNGYLRPGEILIEIDDIFKLLVNSNQFNTSKKRIKLFQKFITFVKEINDLNLVDGISYIIIDGSFCSSKIEPRDIDVFFYFDVASDKQDELEKYMDLNRVKIGNSGIHVVPFYDFSNLLAENIDLNMKKLDGLTRRRFERYYRYSRDNIEKGYLKVLKDKLLLGGEQYVSTVTQPIQSSS